jgi:hypothetical protein
MPIVIRDDISKHFAWMRSVYSELLEEVNVGEYRDAGDALKVLLSEALYAAYLDLHQHKDQVLVELLDFLGCYFVYDSHGAYGGESATRVVGAFASSKEILTLEDLLVRLREEYRQGASTRKTLDLIDIALFVAEDTSPLRRRQALYHSVAAVLDIKSRGLVPVFDQIATRTNYLSRLSHGAARKLRALVRLFGDSVNFDCCETQALSPKKGHFLPEGYWRELRKIIEAADLSLPQERKSELVENLTFFYEDRRELLDRLRVPTDDLLDRVRRYICPIVGQGEVRPRNYAAQRWARLRKVTRHAYDIGHFLPHSAGGPKDINLFLQERRLNRGWSEEGKRYRWFENVVSSRPSTFYFVRPVYEDSSPIPRYLEWGVLLDDAMARELEEEINRMPELFVVRPLESSSRAKLLWITSVFENFPRESLRDLMEDAGF